jgi:hypothetical protein
VKPTKQLKVAGDLSTTITASFPARDESCWFVQLTTKIDSRARAKWSSVFFHNLKTQIQKIWKK